MKKTPVFIKQDAFWETVVKSFNSRGGVSFIKSKAKRRIPYLGTVTLHRMTLRARLSFTVMSFILGSLSLASDHSAEDGLSSRSL